MGLGVLGLLRVCEWGLGDDYLQSSVKGTRRSLSCLARRWGVVLDIIWCRHEC